jgi:branched-chain amino acid transport system substrate-binding protein
VTAAQGDDFQTIGAPAEANTAATKQRAADLAKVGVTGPPTFAEQFAYLTLTGFVAGLKATGPNPTDQSFIKAMSQIKDFDGGGLLAPEKINFRDYAPSSGCLWAAKLTGQKFTVVPGTPICAGMLKFINS